MFLRNWGVLPSELARQDPTLLFMALDTINGDTVSDDATEIPSNMAFFYGM